MSINKYGMIVWDDMYDEIAEETIGSIENQDLEL